MTHCLFFLATLAWSAAAQESAKAGTTADFARAYPYVVLGAIAIMGVIIWYLLRERDEDIKEKLKEASDNFKQANTALESATAKIDATINTLFEHDRDTDKRLSDVEKSQAEQIRTCEMNRKLCPALAKIECLDRREGGDRRQSLEADNSGVTLV